MDFSFTDFFCISILHLIENALVFQPEQEGLLEQSPELRIRLLCDDFLICDAQQSDPIPHPACPLWFQGMHGTRPVCRKKGQRKAPLAAQIRKHGLEPYVSGVSLGEDPAVDAPQVNIQFVLKEHPKRAPELVERLYFDRLPDFIYVEMMRGLQRGFVPKRCPNCGRWFLQTPGATYSYCDGPAPGEEGKTCRDVGATASFQSKVQNNDIWKLHQRAYKKYFARTRKGTMSKAGFEAWSREAEDLRNKALERYSQADGETEREQIVQKLKEKLNRI